MRRADQITGIVMLIFSLIIAYTSWQMPQRVEFGPGMGFLPFWLAVLMAVLSVMKSSLVQVVVSLSPNL